MSATAGRFVALANAPSVGITSFTHAHLAASLVRFEHDGSEPAATGFAVVLRDAAGNAAGPVSVTANVLPTDDPLGAVQTSMRRAPRGPRMPPPAPRSA